MSEETQTMMQLLELLIRGASATGKGIQFVANGAKKGTEFAQLKILQTKQRLHYASTGKHSTLLLKDLEKITGEQYNILNIPLENEKELVKFYDRLKKAHVDFAELPDLEIGDGYTQIAYNPMDAEKVKMVVDYYKEKNNLEAKDMTIEDYAKTGGKEGEQKLAAMAEKGYRDEITPAQVKDIKEGIKNKDNIPVSLNMDSLLLKEEKDAYVFQLPKGNLSSDAGDRVFRVLKNNCLLLDDGKTAVTYFKKDGTIDLFAFDGKSFDGNNAEKVKVSEVTDAFAPMSNLKLNQIQKLSNNDSGVIPTFGLGREDDSSPARFTKGEKNLSSIISTEQIKERRQSPEYLPLQFNQKNLAVAEDGNVYLAQLPRQKDDFPDSLHCVAIPKEDAYVDKNGNLTAYVKVKDVSTVMEFNSNGQKLTEKKMDNSQIARNLAKNIKNDKPVVKNQSLKEISELAEKVVTKK